MVQADKASKAEFYISVELNKSIGYNILNKNTDDYINYYELLGSYIIEKLKEFNIDVSYCPRCLTLKLANEFAEAGCCKICNGKPTRVTVELFKAAMDKTKGKCAICSEKTTTIHHILPKRYGGKDELDNLIPLCSDCHLKAHNGTYRHDHGYNLEIAEICKSY